MTLTEVLAQALKLEKDGKKFYNDMANRVEDEAGQAMFKQLAADEVDHYNYIQRQYETLQEGGEWSSIPELGRVDEIDAVSVVFPPEEKVLTDLPDDPDEQDALLFGLNIEDKSFKLYYNSAQQAEDPAAENMFLQLAAAEQRHFEILMQRYESRYNYPR